MPVKINIHIPIRGKLFSDCLEINKIINQKEKSAIDFSATSLQIPHLTLLMGTVYNKESLDNIFNTVAELSNKINPFVLPITNPYIKQPNNKYLFIDVKDNGTLEDFQNQLKRKINTEIECSRFGGINFEPHITLGYCASKFEKPMNFNLSIGEINIDAIEISLSGSKGSCIGSLRTFEFVTSKDDFIKISDKSENPISKYDLTESAGGIVYTQINDLTYIILLRRKDGFWVLPKGHKKNECENTAETALREISEECGLSHRYLEIKSELDIYLDNSFSHLGEKKIVHIYKVHFTENSLQKLTVSSEHEEAIWWRIDSILPQMRYLEQENLVKEFHIKI